MARLCDDGMDDDGIDNDSFFGHSFIQESRIYPCYKPIFRDQLGNKRPDYLREAFVRSLVVPKGKNEDPKHTFTPPKIPGHFEDFAPIFLAQARLYVLANKYGVENLSQLVLSKTYDILYWLELYETGVEGILEFVRFVYLNTPPAYSRIDPMRNLATRYVVSVLCQIGETEAFQGLLEEGGDFAVDFWHIFWGF